MVMTLTIYCWLIYTFGCYMVNVKCIPANFDLAVGTTSWHVSNHLSALGCGCKKMAVATHMIVLGSSTRAPSCLLSLRSVFPLFPTKRDHSCLRQALAFVTSKSRPWRSRPSGVSDFEVLSEFSVNGAGARSIARLKRPGYQNISRNLECANHTRLRPSGSDIPVPVRVRSPKSSTVERG